MIDATFATPVNCRPAAFGVDLVVHSATKYLAGHNDVLAGVVCGPAGLVSMIRDLRGVLGGVCDPHAAFLVGRGLKTLALRVERQNATALAVAERLEKHPRVERVFYPGLASHPSHAVARAQMRGFGGVVSFIVKGGLDGGEPRGRRAEARAHRPELRRRRVARRAARRHELLRDDHRGARGHRHRRRPRAPLASGIEDTADLIADIEQPSPPARASSARLARDRRPGFRQRPAVAGASRGWPRRPRRPRAPWSGLRP